ncbi:ergothioneine biosynthesis protein EgtC [Pseudarthrobacter enclensis]|uniref:Gamma-glutamyl-hercynylcysteine sulfoxide hydrolase n=1 Tax=Pseudarthrobacter enclensis TaxID=993070 RepID=A0ABT9RZT1_9MICC|nr:ergothioneine biosynthesis protein EgtC [Pseudarthrobacter enclensis]MDP9890153.1 glutamine amidotransferase [Pseudarthrobacter enclensis]
MCRHIAYLGNSLSLADLLIAPAFGLFRQSWAPRQQQYGAINADGFGAGWYAEDDVVPARYRRAVPIWADRSFADVARVSRSHCILAAVRSATETMAPDESAAAPFSSGPWLFSHNGRVNGWPGSVKHLAAGLPASRLLEMEAPVDSALLWALVLERLERGEEPGNALGQTAADASAAAGGRYNFLLTDGHRIAATACGDTLFWRAGPDGVAVASEPFDDGPGWRSVPENTILTAAGGEVALRPLPAPWKDSA